MPSDQPRKLRCAIYTRKSSEEGLEQSFNSLDAQREACAAYVLSQRHEGWTEISKRYDDGGFSGGNMTRPALAALMRDIDAGLIDSVVVYKVDRLTRSLADFAKIVDCFDAKKVSFVSVTQQFNTTTSMGRLTLNVLLSFAQFEREVTGERIRDKIAASKKKGMWMGGRVPVGYNVKDRKLVVNELEADGVRHVFRRYLETGCVAALKADLDAQGIVSKVRLSRTGKTSGGLPYSRGALYELLQNRLYIGRTNHKNHDYPGEHAAIIDDELWDAVQAKVSANTQGHRSSVRAKAPSLLVGKVFTEEGLRLVPSHTAKGGRRYRYYVATSGSPKMRVPAADLERIVEERLKAFLVTPREVVDTLSIKDTAIDQAALVTAATVFLKALSSSDVVLRQVVDRVTVGPSGCKIECSTRHLKELLLGAQSTTEPDDHVFELHVDVRRRSLGVRLVLAPTEHGSSIASSSLVKAAARGRYWYDGLTAGKGVSLTQLAYDSSVNDRYTSKILRCAFLAPDLVERVLEGQVGDEQSLKTLLAKLPRRWDEQRRLFDQ